MVNGFKLLYSGGIVNEVPRFIGLRNVSLLDVLERLIADLKCPGDFGYILDVFRLQKIKLMCYKRRNDQEAGMHPLCIIYPGRRRMRRRSAGMSPHPGVK